MTKEELVLQRTNARPIYGYVWKPKTPAIGIIHLIHGMTECMDRYEVFADYFTKFGYIVCGYDIDGHGRSKYSNVNAVYTNSWESLVSDLEYFRIHMKQSFPNVPYYMIGFSLGSFILRHHQCIYENTADKLIYIGTGQPKLSELKFARFLVDHLCKKKDVSSNLVKKLAFDNYNSKIHKPNGPAAWLIKDKEKQDEYLNDPSVILNMTAKFFLEFIHGMISVQELEKRLYCHKLVLFIAGEEDPVADLKHSGMTKVEKAYKRSDAIALEHIIPGFRHDVLHDTCCKETFQEIKEFLEL